MREEVNRMAIDLAILLEDQQKIDVEDSNIMVEAFTPKKRDIRFLKF